MAQPSQLGEGSSAPLCGNSWQKEIRAAASKKELDLAYKLVPKLGARVIKEESTPGTPVCVRIARAALGAARSHFNSGFDTKYTAASA